MNFLDYIFGVFLGIILKVIFSMMKTKVLSTNDKPIFLQQKINRTIGIDKRYQFIRK